MTAGEDELRFTFEAALGAAFHCADPNPEAYEIDYEERLKMELKRGPTGGGCG
jgi:hypothetical protein